MRAVLWDLDDTLLDTADARMAALEHAYRECLGANIDGRRLWREHHGGTLEQLAQRLLGDDGPRFVTSYRDYYYSRRTRVEPHAGIAAALEGLLAEGAQMAVVTQKISWGATEELISTGLMEYFHSVIGFDDTEAHKPEPEPIYEALDRLLIEPGEDVYFVGDSPADMLAARNAGCRSVAAFWGTLGPEELRATGADHSAERPLDVLDIVRARSIR